MRRTGVLGEAALLGVLVGVLLIAVTRGCSRGDVLGGEVGMYGVVGGREIGGGKTGGRAVGVGVVGCDCSSGIASRARVWAGWGFGSANRAPGVGVAGSAAASRASSLIAALVTVCKLPFGALSHDLGGRIGDSVAQLTNWWWGGSHGCRDGEKLGRNRPGTSRPTKRRGFGASHGYCAWCAALVLWQASSVVASSVS